MADELSPIQRAIGDDSRSVGVTNPPKRAKRSRPKLTYGIEDGIALTADELVTKIDNLVREEQRKRSFWIEQRYIRYAKLRGWLESKDWPWENASNQHVPVMLANCLRVEAGLFNAVLGVRPVMNAKPTRKDQKEGADRAAQLIDFQIFMEGDGDQRIEQYITQYVEDGTVVSFQPWVRDRREIHDVRVIPAEPDDQSLLTYLFDVIPTLMPGIQQLAPVNADGMAWEGVVVDASKRGTPISIDVYDRDDDMLELALVWEATLFDGPTIVVHQLEDIVVPLRAENTQPITPQNPYGAPWVARLVRTDFDTIKRRQRDGTYDLLTEDDLDDIEGVLGMRKPLYYVENNEDFLREQKDTKEGRFYLYGGEEAQREWITAIEWYGRWDVNDDGLDEEVIFTFCKEARKLMRARYLTEQYPGLPVRRPFAESRFIPVPGQFYGIGLPEVMEGVHDALHVLVNQNVDNGTLANTPFFFYRASSGLKPEVIRLWPGEGYPLDNPQQDVAFPQFPQRDQQWNFNMIGLWMQFLDKVTQIGPIQMGQVPQGKASALRTTGTTMALLQQGAAMPEQILRRLFMGLRQIWEQCHLLNLRYLPKNKAYLIAGKPLDQDDAYGTVKDPEEIAVPIAFDFVATLLNTNKGLMASAIQTLGGALVSPLLLQAGIITAEGIYNWAEDLIKATQLDPARYIHRPKGMPEGPRHTAEEVILMLIEQRMPEVAPLEDPQEHMEKLQKFMQSDEFGYLSAGGAILFKNYLMGLQQLIQATQQQQQMMQAAQQFSQQMKQQSQVKGGPPTTGQVPPMQTQQATQSEINGANASHGNGQG